MKKMTRKMKLFDFYLTSCTDFPLIETWPNYAKYPKTTVREAYVTSPKGKIVKFVPSKFLI